MIEEKAKEKVFMRELIVTQHSTGNNHHVTINQRTMAEGN